MYVLARSTGSHSRRGGAPRIQWSKHGRSPREQTYSIIRTSILFSHVALEKFVSEQLPGKSKTNRICRTSRVRLGSGRADRHKVSVGWWHSGMPTMKLPNKDGCTIHFCVREGGSTSQRIISFYHFVSLFIIRTIASARFCFRVFCTEANASENLAGVCGRWG